MSVTTSYPGVYIEENTTPVLAVNAASTSVPIIALWEMAGGPAQKFDNFLEFNKSPMAQSDSSDPLYMRAYFECGGGPCYVVSFL
jgi:hypothetical protein